MRSWVFFLRDTGRSRSPPCSALASAADADIVMYCITNTSGGVSTYVTLGGVFFSLTPSSEVTPRPFGERA